MTDKQWKSYKVIDNGNCIIFSVPSYKIFPLILFLVPWLIAWAFMDVYSIKQFLNGVIFEDSLEFTIFWLIFINVIGILTIYTLLWQFFGKETIEISSGYIKLTRTILNFGLLKEYSAENIKEIHIDTVKNNPLFIGIKHVSLEKECRSVAFN